MDETEDGDFVRGAVKMRNGPMVAIVAVGGYEAKFPLAILFYA